MMEYHLVEVFIRHGAPDSKHTYTEIMLLTYPQKPLHVMKNKNGGLQPYMDYHEVARLQTKNYLCPAFGTTTWGPMLSTNLLFEVCTAHCLFRRKLNTDWSMAIGYYKYLVMHYGPMNASLASALEGAGSAGIYSEVYILRLL